MDNDDLNQIANIKHDSNMCKVVLIEIELKGDIEDKEYAVSITHYAMDLIDKQIELKVIDRVLDNDNNMVLTSDFKKVEQQTYALRIISKKQYMMAELIVRIKNMNLFIHYVQVRRIITIVTTLNCLLSILRWNILIKFDRFSRTLCITSICKLLY